MDKGFCYLFLVESGERTGGAPVEQQVVYVSADGVVQASTEMSDGVILELGQAETNAARVLASLRQAEAPAPVREQPPDPGAPLLVSEGWGPTLTVEAGRCDGSVSRWSGDPEALSEPQRSVVADVRALRSTVEAHDLRPGAIYIRAERLESDAAKHLAEAGRLSEMTEQQLEANPPLSAALRSVRRLVPVPEEFKEYDDLPARPLRGTRLYVAHMQAAYQVRHLVSGPE